MIPGPVLLEIYTGLGIRYLFFDVLAGTGTAYDMLDVSYAFL